MYFVYQTEPHNSGQNNYVWTSVQQRWLWWRTRIVCCSLQICRAVTRSGLALCVLHNFALFRTFLVCRSILAAAAGVARRGCRLLTNQSNYTATDDQEINFSQKSKPIPAELSSFALPTNDKIFKKAFPNKYTTAQSTLVQQGKPVQPSTHRQFPYIRRRELRGKLYQNLQQTVLVASYLSA